MAFLLHINARGSLCWPSVGRPSMLGQVCGVEHDSRPRAKSLHHLTALLPSALEFECMGLGFCFPEPTGSTNSPVFLPCKTSDPPSILALGYVITQPHLKFNINKLATHLPLANRPFTSQLTFFPPPTASGNQLARQCSTDFHHRPGQNPNLSRRSLFNTTNSILSGSAASHVWLRGGCWLLLAPPHDYTPGHARNAPWPWTHHDIA